MNKGPSHLPEQGFQIATEIWVPRELNEVFAFFADASNLEFLTPAWLNFHIITPTPLRLGIGTLIDYRLRLRGIPIRWRSEITAWSPPHRFVDEQRRGPYKWWIHEHVFESRDAGTLVRDRVHYGVPCGALVNRLLVRPDLDRIFAYRHEVLQKRFSTDSR